MIEWSYWYDEAAKYAELAQTAKDPGEQQELLELAEICVDVAAKVEERSTGG